jgi:Flp pilus assembly protein TadG
MTRIFRNLTRLGTSRSRGAERGQVLVIVGVGLLAMVAIVGLVIDVGHAWGQQRDSQNASDSGAEAGATLLAQNLPYQAAGEPVPNSNADIAAAVTDALDANAVQIVEAWYTDFDGDRVGGAPLIGTGALAGADNPDPTWDGVEVTSYKEFDTFLAGMFGMNTWTTQTRGTAIAGYPDALSQTVLPVTFPLTITTCSSNNHVLEDPSALQWRPDTDYVVPLCQQDPGNVGWLDWDPPPTSDPDTCPGNGNPELICSILTPDNPTITTPEWYYVASTGNPSAQSIEDALMTYANGPDDEVVIIPIFDATCQDDPIGTGAGDCTSGPGTGQQQYYHLAGWAGFDIEWVDLNGGPTVCGSGNGSTGCFKGQFKYFGGLPSGTLSEATGNESPLAGVGVLLIDSK